MHIKLVKIHASNAIVGIIWVQIHFFPIFAWIEDRYIYPIDSTMPYLLYAIDIILVEFLVYV